MIKKTQSWDFEKLNKAYDKIVKTDLPIVIGNKGLNHFLLGFRKGGGQTDKSSGGWKKSTSPVKPSGATLVKSGLLRQAMRVKKATFNEILISTLRFTKDYAEIHNQGGKIRITKKMRSFFWAMYYKANNKVEYNKKTGEVQKKSIKKSNEAEFWLNMAMHKGSFIKIPQREFIGDSKVLEEKVYKEIGKAIDKVFKE